MKTYKVRQSTSPDAEDFAKFADSAEICEFRGESSPHRPHTEFRLLYNNVGISGRFDVQDQFVRAVNLDYNSPVCTDSCVEFFVKPPDSSGYFNFEFNCIGTILSYYITDHRKTEDGFAEFAVIPPELLTNIKVETSLPHAVIDPEITKTVHWSLSFFIPFSIFAEFAENFQIPEPGDSWRANFYKCGDKTSHPHWAAWSPVPELNFHLPDAFGSITFV